MVLANLAAITAAMSSSRGSLTGLIGAVLAFEAIIFT